MALGFGREVTIRQWQPYQDNSGHACSLPSAHSSEASGFTVSESRILS